MSESTTFERAIWIVGIDPGLTGAIALLHDSVLQDVVDMPHYDGRVDCQALAAQLMTYQPDVIVVEDVHSMPKQGVASSFKFGRSLGAIEGAIGALSLPHVKLTPQRWKQKMGLLKKDKDASRGLARELWPHKADEFKLKKHDGRAEAALMAEALRRMTWDS